MENLKSKRFVVRKSLIGKNQIIEVTFSNGKIAKYNHDDAFEVMKETKKQEWMQKAIDQFGTSS